MTEGGQLLIGDCLLLIGLSYWANGLLAVELLANELLANELLAVSYWLLSWWSTGVTASWPLD